MSFQSLPPEILLQIILSSKGSFEGTSSIQSPLAALRSTCKRFCSLLSSNAPYLSPSLLPTLPASQTYQKLNTYLPAPSKPQPQSCTESEGLADLITQLSRSFIAHSLLSRIRYAAEQEQQSHSGCSANLAEYSKAIGSIPTSLCALRDISTFSDILSLPACPPSAEDATSRPQGWKTYLLQQHLKSIKELSAFDSLIAVLFAMSTLVNERRRSWLVTVQSYAATMQQSPSTNTRNDIEGQRSMTDLAEDLLHTEVSTADPQAPTYAYTSLHKFKTAELILRKGPRWVHDLISRLEELEGAMICYDQTCSPIIGPANVYGRVMTTEDRVREFLVPMGKIESKRSETVDKSFDRIAESMDGLPLLKVMWKERERKSAWKMREERERVAREQEEASKTEAEAERTSGSSVQANDAGAVDVEAAVMTNQANIRTASMRTDTGISVVA